MVSAPQGGSPGQNDRKSIGKFPQNKTKQNAALSTLLRICRILFCFVLLAREGGRPAGWGMDSGGVRGGRSPPRLQGVRGAAAPRLLPNLKIVRKIAKVKKFTKIVPVRAGKLSTTPFCTEFRRESNRADGISPNPLFWKVNFLGFPTYFYIFFPVWGLRWGHRVFRLRKNMF